MKRWSPAERRALFSHPAGWIASGFGAGLSPFAPGTAGSAVALLLWFFLRELPPALHLGVILAAFALGVWASAQVVRRLAVADPGVIVWDEFVGQWVALVPLVAWPPSGLASQLAWAGAGFLLFRLFDVWKPWPTCWADRHIGGGLGVMADDVVAGLQAALVLALLLRVP